MERWLIFARSWGCAAKAACLGWMDQYLAGQLAMACRAGAGGLADEPLASGCWPACWQLFHSWSSCSGSSPWLWFVLAVHLPLLWILRQAAQAQVARAAQ